VDDLYSNRSDTKPPDGFCVANEIDPRRAYVLAHRARETLQERQVSLTIACHNATKFPNVHAGSTFAPTQNSRDCDAPYDRIICDVPCSGDGTLRKDLKVWKTWHPSYGMALHPLQIRIAKRGIALLKVGGIMTYSTCSFHPLENEAVVAALLATKCVEILPPKKLSEVGIVSRPGLSHWKVLDDDLNAIDSGSNKTLPPTLWPPQENSKSIIDALSNCVRMVPQDNDTGGFFIAVLKKIRDFPTRNRKQKVITKVSPKEPHHQLYRQDARKQQGGCIHFKRSPSSNQVFAVAPSLAKHVDECPGSDKLNLVMAGFKRSDH